MREPLLKRLERMPVPVLPTVVGAATLSNVYNGIGFSWVRHITMWAASFVIILYAAKILLYPATCKKEYGITVPASLYAGFSMTLMILGSYYFDFSPAFGKGLWLAGLCIHACHILVFTFNNVIKSRSVDVFVPSWFVTYNGIMVSCVVGGPMNEPEILTAITYYGICLYFILIVLLLYRLARYEIKEPLLHTLAIVLAPCSLCVVSYLNTAVHVNHPLILLLYGCVLLSLLFVLLKLPQFFSYPFSPAFAGLTFPMAIGIVASTKMAAYLESSSFPWAEAIRQLSGAQTYITTGIITFVVFNFFKLAAGNKVT